MTKVVPVAAHVKMNDSGFGVRMIASNTSAVIYLHFKKEKQNIQSLNQIHNKMIKVQLFVECE
jgi:hypothetical protein